MATKPKSLSWLLPLMSALFLLSGLTACGGGDDEVSENGGGIKVDPNIPTLSEISYELAPKAVIVPEATIKQITAVDTESHKFTLPSSASKPEVGQTLIINIPTTQLPDGLLAKVKSVTETSNGYQVTYEDAELKDAFKDIDVPEQYIPLGEYVQHVYDADGKEIKFETRANTRISGMKDFTIVIPEVSWKIAEGIELTPKMTIDLLLRYVMQFGDYELSYAAAKIDADVTIGADLAATIDETSFGEKRWRILQLQFAPVPVPAPPAVPILLLKPAIGIDIVAKAEGKITLEASISYERTMHASMIYQKGAGLSGNFNLDPEADDALKFSFGPKFEGGLGFGPSMLTWIGVYGEAMCLRGTLDMLAKQTISGKLDLTAFTGTTDDLLTPFKFDPNTHSDWDEDLKETLKNAKKWDFQKWESLNYNLSFAEKMKFQLIALGKTVSELELPDVNVPILSIPIMPQFKIDENDFFDFKDNNVTLLLHHTKKSVLDGLAEFYVEFKPVDSKTNANTIVKYFDFDDEKRNWLVAEVKGKDVTTTAKATLNGEDDYDIMVYMKILGEEILIFEGYAKKNVYEPRTDITGFSFYGTITTTFDNGRGGIEERQEDLSFNSFNGPWTANATKTKDSYRVTGTAKYGQLVSSYFDCEAKFDFTAKLTKSGIAEINDLKLTITGTGSGGYKMERTASFSSIAFEGDYENGKLYKLFWRDTEEKTLRITDFKGGQDIFWGGEFGDITQSFTYKSNPKNSMGVTLEFGGE